jgi:hypothetical protein
MNIKIIKICVTKIANKTPNSSFLGLNSNMSNTILYSKEKKVFLIKITLKIKMETFFIFFSFALVGFLPCLSSHWLGKRRGKKGTPKQRLNDEISRNRNSFKSAS